MKKILQKKEVSENERTLFIILCSSAVVSMITTLMICGMLDALKR